MTLSRKQRLRRSMIIRTLSDLSRDGWNRAKACDYELLETELRTLEEEDK